MKFLEVVLAIILKVRIQESQATTLSKLRRPARAGAG
jgi:hypothetical protein